MVSPGSLRPLGRATTPDSLLAAPRTAGARSSTTPSPALAGGSGPLGQIGVCPRGRCRSLSDAPGTPRNAGVWSRRSRRYYHRWVRSLGRKWWPQAVMALLTPGTHCAVMWGPLGRTRGHLAPPHPRPCENSTHRPLGCSTAQVGHPGSNHRVVPWSPSAWVITALSPCAPGYSPGGLLGRPVRGRGNPPAPASTPLGSDPRWVGRHYVGTAPLDLILVCVSQHSKPLAVWGFT